MTNNPYAKPSEGQTSDIPLTVPSLWNPNAAVNWSFLFSPAFGAFLHMKNWQALNEPKKANVAKIWAIISLIALVVTLFGEYSWPDIPYFVMRVNNSGIQIGMLRIMLFFLLLIWYFASARQQTRYIRERLGTTYTRKAWIKPICLAGLAVFGPGLVINFFNAF